MFKQFWKNAPHSFPEPKVTPLNCVRGPPNGPKLKDSSSTSKDDKEKQKIFTFEEADTSKCLNNDLNN